MHIKCEINAQNVRHVTLLVRKEDYTSVVSFMCPIGLAKSKGLNTCVTVSIHVHNVYKHTCTYVEITKYLRHLFSLQYKKYKTEARNKTTHSKSRIP